VPNPGMEQLLSHRFTSSMAPDLLAVLSNKDEKPRVRAAAAEAVAAINPYAEKTLEALKKLLDPARDVVERRAAARGLKRMLAMLPESQPDAQPVGGPGARPQGFPPAPPAGQPPIAQPQDSSPLQNTRADLVTAAGLGLIDKNDATVRLLCLEAIQQALERRGQFEISRPLALAVNKQTPAVIALLADADLKACLAAHQVLEGIAAARWKMPMSGFVPRAENRLAEGAKLLAGILEALPALKRSLANEKEVRVRLAALYVLETLGHEAAAAVDDLVKVLEDKNGYVRWGAVRVLNNMAPRQAEKAAPALVGRLTDKNSTVRLAAAQALGRYGWQAKAAVKSLEKAIGDSEPHVRLAAIHALAAIGPDAHAAAGAVVQALADKQQKPEVRSAAAQALRRLGPLAAEAKIALAQALEDSDSSIRQAASETLLEKD